MTSLILQLVRKSHSDVSDLQDILGYDQYVYGNYYFMYALEKHRYDGVYD
jgi:hypothetical protein